MSVIIEEKFRNEIGEIKMKVSPYIFFNDNCAKDAAQLYEKAFNVKAHMEMTPEGVSHAQLVVGNDTIMFCDSPGEPASIGNNIMITIKFDDTTADAARAAYHILKEDGEVIMEVENTDWSKFFSLVVDKFGVKWNFCQDL